MRVRIFPILLAAVATFRMNVATAGDIAYGVQVVVIDAGHGGDDPGAHYYGTYEKTLTLNVALKLGKLIEEGMPGVKVVYPRKTDKALAPTKIADLQARADIANKAGGDLFISIHVNAAEDASARGVETLVMGESSKEQRYNEDALYENNRDDLIDMSDERTAAIVRAYIQNLQFTYGQYSMAIARCIQNNYGKTGRHVRKIKPQLLRVLYATDMPGVLTEIGFLSNPREAAYLKSEKGQDEIARSLFNAVKDYSTYLLEMRRTEEPPEPAAKPAEPVKPAAEPVFEPVKKQGVHYAIQILSGRNKVARTSPEFKNYAGKILEYTAEGTFRYKYCVYESDSKAQAQSHLAEVRKTFPEAFVVRCRGDKIVK
ncbi:MAG: N-acetylmuramoyl-L-alanine amidase [Alistipes sp.]|nr:N-acetylmuramoyl-L-alanine amidase [Alistipes sp.]